MFYTLIALISGVVVAIGFYVYKVYILREAFREKFTDKKEDNDKVKKSINNTVKVINNSENKQLLNNFTQKDIEGVIKFNL